MNPRSLVLGLLVILSLPSPPAFANPFDNWAALVVAGDWHAHSGAASDVFDNARRDLVKELMQMGFAKDHIQQYSAHPDADRSTMSLHSDPATIEVNFRKLAEQATSGCFAYLTTHGAPLGVVLGDSVVAIREIGDLLDETCPGRPTVVIVSACYSGMFIPVLHADNRMIVTAARGDRTSFGCSEANTYTFFDQCVLESLPKSTTFPMLSDMARECVTLREKAEMVEPPSEPQVYIGSAIARQFEQFTFSLQ